MVACFVIGQLVPFNALEVVWNPRQVVYLSGMYLVFFVPFFFAASCIGLALTCLKTQISRIYFFDLLGAGAGALIIISALFAFSPQGALRLLTAIALFASVLMANRPIRVYALACFLLLLFLPQSLLEFRMSPFKGLSQALEVVDSKVLTEVSSPLGLVTVVASQTIPFRDAPGLSLNSRTEPPEQLAIFTDGDSMSVITRYEGSLESLDYLADMTAALPYRLLDEPRVLILGAGGGTDVLSALYHGAREIDAVELNPIVTELVGNMFAEFAGNIYDDDRVTVHVGEARGFITRQSGRFDLIQIALLDSFSSAGSGVQALNESYLYTVEAIGEYLRHLEPGGILAITRWLRVPPRDSLKLLATAIEALGRAGVAHPGQQLVLVRSWNTSTMLVRNGEFADQDIEKIHGFSKSRSFDLSFYPNMPASEANRYNVLPGPYLYDGASALLSDNAAGYIDRYKFDISPATDDRPYFSNFFRWGSLPEALALRKRGGADLIEWGYLILIGTLVQALVAGALLILLPLLLVKRSWQRGTGRRMGGYFFLLGLSFMFVEIAFIQKLILFLGHPLYSVAVVLSGFLVFAGIGSGYSKRLVARFEAGDYAPVTIIVVIITGISLAYILILPEVFGRLVGLPDILKVGLSLLFIGPLAFWLGMPFPIGLGSIAKESAAFIPWAWGLNGFASVIGASLATLLAIEFGFTAVILLSLALYALAAALFRRVL